jgi:hypothetical protein
LRAARSTKASPPDQTTRALSVCQRIDAARSHGSRPLKTKYTRDRSRPHDARRDSGATDPENSSRRRQRHTSDADRDRGVRQCALYAAAGSPRNVLGTSRNRHSSQPHRRDGSARHRGRALRGRPRPGMAPGTVRGGHARRVSETRRVARVFWSLLRSLRNVYAARPLVLPVCPSAEWDCSSC